MRFVTLSRDYMITHLEDVMQLLEGVPNEYWGSEHFLSNLPEKWELSLAVIQDNSLLGYIICSKKEEAIHTHKFIVAAGARGKGLGQVLLFELEKRIKQAGYRKHTLKVALDNEHAIRFYLRNRFELKQQDGAYLLLEKHLEKVVAIHQPNLIPWLGYFYKMYQADAFVLLGDVQVSKGSVAARNQIKNRQGQAVYISASLASAGGGELTYRTAAIDYSSKWHQKAWNLIKDAYGKAPGYADHANWIEHWLKEPQATLGDMAEAFIYKVRDLLEINTPLYRSSELHTGADAKNDRNLAITQALKGDIYLSGKGAQTYNDEAAFQSAGVKLAYSSFISPTYAQINGDFIPNLSVLDALLNLGSEKVKELLIWNSVEKVN